MRNLKEGAYSRGKKEKKTEILTAHISTERFSTNIHRFQFP